MNETRHDSRGVAICGAVTILLPFSFYLFTAAPAPSWLDSGEFLATGFVLGSAHPPGHPVFVTLVKLFSLLPFGSLAFRGALASAVPAALSCFLLFRILLLISRRLDTDTPKWLSLAFALFGALLFGSTPALWTQAIRPEVYALQLALMLLCLLSLLGFALGERGTRDGRLLTAAGLAFGLSLANHHFLSLLLMPGIIVLLTEDALKQWRRTLRLVGLGVVPAIIVGLVPYVHLPLRASRAPGAVSLGATPDVATFLWVVSAKAFQKAVTQPPTTSFGERLTEAAFLLASQLGTITGAVLTLMALGGLYFLVRQRWGAGALIVLAFLASWMARSWMGFDPQNPDILGYLLIPVCVLCLGAARVGPLLVNIIPSRLTVRIGAATVVALTLIGTTVFFPIVRWHRLDMSEYRSAELVAAEQLDRLPPRSIVITELFGSGFNLWAAQTVEGMRPDISHLHFPFVGFPSYVSQVNEAHHDLRGILRSALAHGELDEREISNTAQRRPVYIEPMLQTPRAIRSFLLPRGLLWEAAAEPLSLTDVRIAVPDHFARWDELIAILGDEAHDEQTRRVLLWRLYVDALLFAQRGERSAADESARRGLALAPGTPELEQLREALAQGEGRLDVTPFLPAGAQGNGEPSRDQPEGGHEGTTRPRVLDF